MDSGTIAGSTREASDGFFSSIVSSINEGVNRVATEVLPNWAGQQLLDQKNDLLYQPTNYVTPAAQTTTQTTTAQPVLFDFNKIGTQITAGSLLAIGLIGVGGYFLFKKLF